MNYFDATLIPGISEVLLLVSVAFYLIRSRKEKQQMGPF
jgi:hypothetical protein